MIPTATAADEKRAVQQPTGAGANGVPEVPEPALIARQRALLRELVRLAADRARTEPEIERGVQARNRVIEREFEEDYQAIIIRFASAKEATDLEVREAREVINARFEEEEAVSEQEMARARRRILARHEEETNQAKAAFQESRWTLAALLESGKTEAEARFQEVREQVAGQVSQLRTIEGDALALLEKWGQRPEEFEPAPGEPAPDPGLRKLPECVARAEAQLAALRDLVVPGLARGARFYWLLLLVGLLLGFPAALLGRWLVGPEAAEAPVTWAYGPAGLIVLLVVAGVITRVVLRSVARRQVSRAYLPLAQVVRDAAASRRRIEEHYTKKLQTQLLENKQRHTTELRRALRKYRAQRAACKKARNDTLRQAREEFQRRRADSAKRRANDLRQSEERHQSTLAAIQERYERESREVHERRDRLLQDSQTVHDEEARELAERWRQGLARAEQAVAEVTEQSQRLFPAWDDPSWEAWQPPADVPPAVRFGAFWVGMDRILNGAAMDADPLPRPADFSLPALFPFRGRCSLLLEAADTGRAGAVQVLQAVMFRLLTALPPGKVRFTIIDPVGLGQNFAAFMHLADYLEALVGSRIWTEQPHIEQRLADLTAHMENVIQKYLRNQFLTIEDYNAHAGEVAEPFRFLVIANFPANFTTEAARRLVSVAQSGRRCGVHTLISVDTKQSLPQGFDLAELEEAGAVLVWDGGRFTWKDGDFGPFPLVLDEPPPDGLTTRILHVVGERAREASRVEVPFEFIAPPAEQWWTGDSRSGISVPLGRAGATKRQHLRLGHGTSQHVLVAGKTGSGKSTLLHALVTNLALLYSPDQVELFLIDFKKGVEFKTYAAHELPHARVVAIESEREFGLSVLQRLDAELKHRGDRFRSVGAQDLAAYRQATGDAPLPRILLIVDEFQEFFVEDDRIAQDAAQLLDRLVRQGRAFGLHVLLGSQTLGGAYTLARSTIDQMAVRIALQCSEADAHLILSDENSAARLLSRPGEAIYNDANGLVEGNNPFQVVWLPDERREVYLDRVRELERQRQPGPARPQLVFEGNIAADPDRNHLLGRLLEAPTWAAEPRALAAWLGEPMSIKDPTAATFRPQSASNLLIVGQQDEEALAIMIVSLVSLAAQMAPSPLPLSPGGRGVGGEGGPRFFLVDGSPVDAPYAGTLARMAEILPHGVRTAGWRDVPVVMDELAAEVERRQKATDTRQPPVFLFLFGLQRFRDLRRQEDDFGFGRREEKPSPAQQFTTLLHEGAGLGVHTVLWCDTLNNLNRSLDRQGMREFEMRVLFQMSVADSSNLIDTPLASKLGLHRAYYFSEEQGRLEKFRPYGLPPERWLARVRERLRQGTAAGGGG